jgi:hypothetical protein
VPAERREDGADVESSRVESDAEVQEHYTVTVHRYGPPAVRAFLTLRTGAAFRHSGRQCRPSSATSDVERRRAQPQLVQQASDAVSNARRRPFSAG